MNTSNTALNLRDNGGRRSGIDRRYFSYSNHIPERRNGNDRRIVSDRRSGLDRRDERSKVIDLEGKRSSMDRRKAWGEKNNTPNSTLVSVH